MDDEVSGATAAEFDAILEEVTAYLENPPPEHSEADRRFGRLLEMLQAQPVPSFEPHETAHRDEARVAKLDKALARAASLDRRPAFGEHDQGIGPTLGMDVS